MLTMASLERIRVSLCVKVYWPNTESTRSFELVRMTIIGLRYPTTVTIFMSPPGSEPGMSCVQDKCRNHCFTIRTVER